jgi:hypothetical protein
MMVDGKWINNITCPRCKHRHPAGLTCSEARAISDEARRASEVTRVVSERVDAIEVRILRSELNECESDCYFGKVALRKLRAAGVPVLGIVFPIGVARGSLTLTQSDEPFGDKLFVWEDA